ncbi:rhomboid family intramembrane serine protease [Bacteroidales bacterium OttesenSCG-928-A14]|nr:rhomboid family intramembrane serine protease [Bacteroidales bacterium OttesenSCG-928-A14]
MSNTIRVNDRGFTPPIVKNLIIINVIFFIATILLQNRGIDLAGPLGLRYLTAPDFRPWQIITYMFMHGSFNHIFFNMFAIWMFGSVLERYLGWKRFLSYYFVTGIGAALVHYLIITIEIYPTIALMNDFISQPSLDSLKYLLDNNGIDRLAPNFHSFYQYAAVHPNEMTSLAESMMTLKGSFLNSFNVIGASGAVFGLLLAFGMFFPNSEIYLYFLIPIKAKWLVIGYGVIELLTGIYSTNDGIAHFAHLGGMIFGFFMILYWKKQGSANNG